MIKTEETPPPLGAPRVPWLLTLVATLSCCCQSLLLLELPSWIFLSFSLIVLILPQLDLMVRSMSSALFRSEPDTSSSSSSCRVKVEIEEHRPFNKRPKFFSSAAPFHQQWSSSFAAATPPLDEPSPLGLQLRKTPSFMDLIQMKLSQGACFTSQATHLQTRHKGSCAADKFKASNFPVSLLRIGTWEAVSRYEGDLVAKCYYAKHKLVWEVLDGGLKNKMEIQWSDITALSAKFPSDDGLASLDIVLARQPLFFRETNPQPRKHTLWQSTSDFTGGQASKHRRHYLQCPQGLLNKNFEKLIQCDPRLYWISQKPEIVLESPYFEAKGSIFEDLDETKNPGNGDYVCTFSGLREGSSSSAIQSSSSKSELLDSMTRGPTHSSHGSPSPSSVMDHCKMEDGESSQTQLPKRLGLLNQLKVPGLHPSMSMSDLVNHIGHCMSEQKMSGNPLFSDGTQNENMLEEIAQHLLSDSQHASASDEQYLMSRVNSLCCLLQKDPTTAPNLQLTIGTGVDRSFDSSSDLKFDLEAKISNGSSEDGGGPDDNAAGHKQEPCIQRKDSTVDLLHHLPRIASLPQFLHNILEDTQPSQ